MPVLTEACDSHQQGLQLRKRVGPLEEGRENCLLWSRDKCWRSLDPAWVTHQREDGKSKRCKKDHSHSAYFRRVNDHKQEQTAKH
jgi:hypothetical protein